MPETKVIMPQMGESIFEGTLTKWLKKKGEFVNRDEPLFEISTDKVDSEIPSPASGILSEILVSEGQVVEINTVVALIDAEGDAGAGRRRGRAPRGALRHPGWDLDARADLPAAFLRREQVVPGL